MSCPHCHESARFVEYRPKTVQSLVGTFRLDRAYYHCRSCGVGTVPWDEALGLSRQALTPGARELVCIAGAVDSFAEASGAKSLRNASENPRAAVERVRMALS